MRDSWLIFCAAFVLARRSLTVMDLAALKTLPRNGFVVERQMTVALRLVITGKHTIQKV